MKKLYLFLLAVICSVGMAKADYYLPGSWNEWGTSDAVKFVDNTVTLHLDAFTLYEFKFCNSDGDSWSGVDATMVYGDCSNWWLNNPDANVKFLSVDEGNYTFTLGWNDITPVISAVYPTPAVTPVTLTQNDKSITYYASHVGDNYTLVITSASNLNGLGGSFWNTNEGGKDVRQNTTKLNDKVYKFEVASTVAPQLYTPLYVLMPGEVNFGQEHFDWVDADTRQASDLAITSASSLEFDLSESALTSQITYTSSVTGGVTFRSSNEAVATVSETGLITAVGQGTATITVVQAANETTQEGVKTISVTVSNSTFGPMSAPAAQTVPEAQVRSIYGSRYTPAVMEGYKTDNWGSSRLTEERTIGSDKVRIYSMTNAVIVWGENNGSANAIRGKEDTRNGSFTGLDASLMEYLHVDIWCDNARNFTSIINDNGRGAQGVTTAGAWTSYEVPLAGINHGESGIESVRWMKFDGFAAGDVVALANVYFYTTDENYNDQPSVLTDFTFTAASSSCKVGETVALTATPKDQYGQAMEEEVVTYTVVPATAGQVVDGVYTSAEVGVAIITASCGTFNKSVTIVSHMGENLALSASLPESKIVAQTAENPNGSANDAFYAIDGNDGSVWQGDASDNMADHRDYTCSFTVDFGDLYDLNLVTIHFEGACSDAYTIEVSADNETFATAHSFSATMGVNNHTDYIYGDALANAEGVRYLRFTSTKNATEWGMKMFELQAFGTPVEAPEHVYSIVGDLGTVNGETAWDVANTANEITLQDDGTYQLYIRSTYLEKGFYDYKLIADHQYGVYEIPMSGNQTFETWGPGYYEITYTFDPEKDFAEQLTVDVHFSGQWPTGCDEAEAQKARKMLRNGQIVIVKDGKEYNALGQKL